MRTPAFILILLTLSLWTAIHPQSAHAQVLQQQHWTKRADKRIEQLRTVPIRIIVLDPDGKPAPHIPVHLRMLEHTFPFGVHLTPNPKSHDMPNGFIEAAIERGQGPIIWRCFNTINLESITNWPALQPEPGAAWDFSRIDPLLAIADAYNLNVRFGKIIAADPGHAPNWVAKLKPLPLADAIRSHVERITRTYGRRIDAFDIYGFDPNHQFIEQTLGIPMLRNIYQRAKAAAPHADMMLRFDADLTGAGLTQILRTTTAMRQAFIPFDAITIKTTCRGQILQRPLEQALDLIHQLNIPIYISPLEIGGPSPHAAAINLETVLITLFSHPAVHGIGMGEPLTGRATDPNAALFDEQGQPTPAGKIFDQLVRQRWWTDLTTRTNNLGEIRQRVYAGNYQIIITPTATYTNPTTTRIHIPTPSGNNHEHVIVIQPIKTKSNSPP